MGGRWRCVCSRFASGTFRWGITLGKRCYACFWLASLRSALFLGSIRWTLSSMACRCWMPLWWSFSCRFRTVRLTPRRVLWLSHSASILAFMILLMGCLEFAATDCTTIMKVVWSRSHLRRLMPLPASFSALSLLNMTLTLAAAF